MSEPTSDRPWPVAEKERSLTDRLEGDLPGVALLDLACRVLASVIAETPVPSRDEKPSPTDLRHNALWMMAVAAFRAARAARATFGVGYEDQAVGFVRLVDELHNRAQKVREDQSGEYARSWLEGKPIGKGAKLAGQDFWEFVSGPVHADVRGVLDWLAISQEDGSTQVVLGPERRPDVAEPSLVYIASEVRDIASMLAAETGHLLNTLELDAGLKTHHARWGAAVSESEDDA